MVTRREFIKYAAVAGATVALPVGFGVSSRRAYAFAQSPTDIRKFITTLPGVGPAGANNIGQYLPLATKGTTTFAGLATDVYNLGVALFGQKMHPDLPGSTHFWGYYDLATVDQKYLAGVIVAKRGTPVMFNVTNRLPNKALIPIDPTLAVSATQTVGQLPLNRIVTHLHGGFTPWFSDGTPFQWFDPSGSTGASFMNVPGTNPPPGTANYYYPMQQSARLLWYHDHAIGITRTNAYAGIVSALILIDDFEIALVSAGLLPDLIGIPAIVQDKTFVPQNILAQDPTWQWGRPGDLWYPHVYEPNIFAGGVPNPKGRWDWGPTVSPPALATLPLPEPASVVPEAFFDTILVNGGVYPAVSVPPKRVRFRLLNGCQARFLHLNLYKENPGEPGEPLTIMNNPPLAVQGVPGPIIYQLGTEGGFLPAVAIHDNTTFCPKDLKEDPTGNTAKPEGPFNLLLAPAERADVVIDFNDVSTGSGFILYSDAPAPFPGGDARNDYYTGDPDQTAVGGAPTTLPGLGPNTRTLLRIVVGAGSGDSLPTTGPGNWLDQMNIQLLNNFLTGNQPPLLFNDGNPAVPAFPFNGAPNRMLTLNEDFDRSGRLIQTIGTFNSESLDNQGLPTWGIPYIVGATETPSAGATEVWQIFNLTGDTHPIHFHLVNVQIIQRQAFEGTPSRYRLVGKPMRPAPNEIGWKETVRMNPGEVTTVITQFKLPNLPTAAMRNAVSPRTGGHEYVWHCHILEHEEHDMMRPLVVF